MNQSWLMPRRHSQLRALASHLVAVAAPTEETQHPLLSLTGAHARSKATAAGAGSWQQHGSASAGTDSRRTGYGLTTRENTPLPAVNTFGVASLLPGYGVLPKKVSTATAARACLRADGAVILTGLRTALAGYEAYRDAAAALPEQLFGGRLLGTNAPGALVGIVEGASNLEGKPAEPVQRFYREHWGEEAAAAFPPWGPNCAHTDGDAFGDLISHGP
jgi:hypothetical protein